MSALVVNPRVGWRVIAGEVVAFNCATQDIVVWNSIASELWELVVRSSVVTIEVLRDYLVEEYGVEPGQATEDVIRFLAQAMDAGFLGYADGDFRVTQSARGDAVDGETVLLAVEMTAIQNLIPFAVTLETTYACNEHCIHCYMERNLPSLSLQEIQRILGELAESGCLFLTLTGGEFLIRPDAQEILEAAAMHHFVIDVLTNGTLIDPEIASWMGTHSVRRAQVSLYGACAETHDRVSQLQGSFERTTRGINLLRAADVKVEIAVPLMRQNFSEIHQIVAMAHEMGCLVSPSHIITARNDGSDDTFDLRMTDEQLRAFLSDEALYGMYAGRLPFEDHQFYLNFADLKDAAPCYSGFNSCAITPQGIVLPCNQLLYEVGSLREQSFFEIWTASEGLAYLRRLTLRDLSKCASCELLSRCTRCPGLALLEGGNLLGPSPENCRIAAMSQKKGGESR